MARLGWSGDTIADRISLVLPAKFARDHSSNIWKLLRSMAEVFKVNTDGIDELFQQTNLSTASGQFLDDYVNDLTNIGRKESEDDDDYRARFYRNVFVYNGTKNGMKNIVYDILGYEPLALVSKDRGGRFDARYYFNDIQGGSHYGNPSGDPFVGYIELSAKPTSGQIDELCTIINAHKALGVRIYLKYKRFVNITGTYQEITLAVTGFEWCKVIGLNPYGDYFDADGFYNDRYYPAIYGDPNEESHDHKYIYLKEKPEPNQLEELINILNDNLIPADRIYLVYPKS